MPDTWKLKQDEQELGIPAEQAIVAEIAMTNNGKLLKSRMPNALYADMVRMLDEGKLVHATFMERGDAVRLS